MSIKSNKVVVSVRFGLVVTALLVLAQAGWCDRNQSRQESLQNQSEEIQELKRRVSQLEYELDFERRLAGFGTEKPKKHKLEIGRVEIGLSVAMPQQAKVENSKLSLDSGMIYSGHIGFNMTHWLQIGFEVGKAQLKWKERSVYTNKDVTDNITYITPQMRFQGYVGKYVQPFFSFGGGPAFNQYRVKETYSYSYWSGGYQYNSTSYTNYSGKTSGLLGNAKLGICLGKKSSPIKLNGSVRIDFAQNGYIISPSAGFVLSW
jgi:hypothetical protein